MYSNLKLLKRTAFYLHNNNRTRLSATANCENMTILFWIPQIDYWTWYEHECRFHGPNATSVEAEEDPSSIKSQNECTVMQVQPPYDLGLCKFTTYNDFHEFVQFLEDNCPNDLDVLITKPQETVMGVTRFRRKPTYCHSGQESCKISYGCDWHISVNAMIYYQQEITPPIVQPIATAAPSCSTRVRAVRSFERRTTVDRPKAEEKVKEKISDVILKKIKIHDAHVQKAMEEDELMSFLRLKRKEKRPYCFTQPIEEGASASKR